MAERSDRDLLERTYALAYENHAMLRKMRRNAFFGGLLRLIFIAAIFGVPFYLYFTFLQPVVTDVQGTYETVRETAQQASELPSRLEAILQSFGLSVE